MHVLYLHQHFSIPAGATGNRSYAFARRLIDSGHKVTMVCGNYEGGVTGLDGPFSGDMRRGQVDGIDIIEIRVPYSNKMSFLRRTLQFFKFSFITSRLALEQPYDLLFATSTPLTIGIPAIAGRLLKRRPMVFEVRDLWPELPRAMGVISNPVVLRLMSLLEWASYHTADHCIGLSPGIARGIRRRGIAGACIDMIPNGCDLDLFAGERADAAPQSLRAVTAPGDFTAVFTGAHGIANGLDAVLGAARELKRRGNRHIRLLLIGDGREKLRLMREAKAEELDNVVFLPPMPKTELSQLLQHIDLGLMILRNVEAFYYGTSPNKFFDYLAAGKPVLVNYPGWMAGLIEQYDIGYAVPPGDDASFADALEQAAADDGLARKGERALTLARRNFARDDLTDQFVALIERVKRRHDTGS